MKVTKGKLYGLSITYIILHILDLITTNNFLKAGGRELNPIVKNLVENDFFSVIIFKISIVLAILLLYVIIYNKTKKYKLKKTIINCLIILNIYAGLVVVWNMVV